MREGPSPDAIARLIDPEFLREVRKDADRESWRSLYTRLIQSGVFGTALVTSLFAYLIVKNDEASNRLTEPTALVGTFFAVLLFWGVADRIKQAFYSEPARTKKEEQQVRTF